MSALEYGPECDFFMRQKHTFFLQKWPIPQFCVWTHKHLPELDPKDGKRGFSCPKISLMHGVYVEESEPFCRYQAIFLVILINHNQHKDWPHLRARIEVSYLP